MLRQTEVTTWIMRANQVISCDAQWRLTNFASDDEVGLLPVRINVRTVLQIEILMIIV